MYDRRAKGKTLTLAVSGLLWDRSLVMIDRETQSLWSQLLGEAMKGELTGTILKPIPSVMTSWKDWRTRYPQTTVTIMRRTANDYRMARHAGDSDLVIGLVVDGQARMWQLQPIRKQVVVNDELNKVAVVVIVDPASGTAVLHGRRIDDRDLTFAWKSGLLTDRETGSQWDLLTGTATVGPLKGRVLPHLSALISFAQPWKKFHPKSTEWKPPTVKQ